MLFSCEKSDFPIDAAYPTTINRLSGNKLFEERTSFALKNKYLRNSLDEFGFCAYADDFELQKEYPPDSDSITEQEAIDLINRFVNDNPLATGINNVNELKLLYIKKSSTSRWYSKSLTQKIDTIEVIRSNIYFDINNGYVRHCTGNWFPNIYIPSKFNVDQDEARHYLIGKQVTHYGIGDQAFKVTITKDDIQKCKTNLKIIPIRTETKIELRVAWLINISDPVNYKIYIDVMTKKIIYQDPTIIIM